MYVHIYAAQLTTPYGFVAINIIFPLDDRSTIFGIAN